ncbi:MAG: hypothetical protein OXH94_14945 [Rhodospirillales bacterium]|nr:hypothetical protein [Rhodospirillales bacterium]
MPTVSITGWGRGIGHIDYTHRQSMMRANVTAPVRLTPAFIGHLEASGQKKVIRAVGVADGRFPHRKGGAYAR